MPLQIQYGVDKISDILMQNCLELQPQRLKGLFNTDNN